MLAECCTCSTAKIIISKEMEYIHESSTNCLLNYFNQMLTSNIPI